LETDTEIHALNEAMPVCKPPVKRALPPRLPMLKSMSGCFKRQSIRIFSLCSKIFWMHRSIDTCRYSGVVRKALLATE